MADKTKGKKQPYGHGLKQPVEAVGWRKKAYVKVVRIVEDRQKFFQSEVDNGDGIGCGEQRSRIGFKVSSRSKALSHAMDYCNAHKMRIMSVQGVREDKYTLW